MLRLCHKGSGKLWHFFFFIAASLFFQQRLLYSYKKDKALVLEIYKKKKKKHVMQTQQSVTVDWYQWETSGKTATSLSAAPPKCSISSVFTQWFTDRKTLSLLLHLVGIWGRQNAVVLIWQSCVVLFFSYTGPGVSQPALWACFWGGALHD